MKLISVREQPALAEKAVAYFQQKWASENSKMVYEDCILHCIDAEAPLPQWYLLMEGTEIIGCAGLITNDFISRMDLYPWVCALYIEPKWRGAERGAALLARAGRDAARAGFARLYLCTDHIGYYERYGFTYLGRGYHPWGESSCIYEKVLEAKEFGI